MIANSISSLIESILLQASEPLNAQQISKHTGKLSAKEVVEAIDDLKQQLHARRSAYSGAGSAGGFQLFSVEDVFEDLVHVGLTSGPMPFRPPNLRRSRSLPKTADRSSRHRSDPRSAMC